ncbi:hypothetical protein BJ165DRAFT_1528120 [Panaeolus papilionaceus]|nr:hypothetical protein BJ165DRAFT_1528120 [Panaeolus papilionaceus]
MVSTVSLKLVVLALISSSIAAPNPALTAAPAADADAAAVTPAATTTTKALAGPGELCGGGVGWTGPTECVYPYLCIKENPLYWWVSTNPSTTLILEFFAVAFIR